MEGEDIGPIIDLAILIIPFALIAFAMIIGTWLERRHYRSIEAREKATASLPVIPSKQWDDSVPVLKSKMVVGETAVSIDYFKKFLAKLRNLVGGRVRSYETMLDRGRREAILRMKESAPGADMIVNFRLETCAIGKSSRRNKNSVSCVEVVAYGTAVTYAREQA